MHGEGDDWLGEEAARKETNTEMAVLLLELVGMERVSRCSA